MLSVTSCVLPHKYRNQPWYTPTSGSQQPSLVYTPFGSWYPAPLAHGIPPIQYIVCFMSWFSSRVCAFIQPPLGHNNSPFQADFLKLSISRLVSVPCVFIYEGTVMFCEWCAHECYAKPDPNYLHICKNTRNRTLRTRACSTSWAASFRTRSSSRSLPAKQVQATAARQQLRT